MPGDLAALNAEPWRYDFFSALSLVERAYPQLPPPGYAGSLKDDPIRLGQYVSLGFEPAMVKRFIRREGQPARLEVTFFGLLGPNGPMPLHLSEEAFIRLVNQQDPSLAHFLDLFHHRLLGVLYRSWSQAHRCLPDYLSALTGMLHPQPERAADRQVPGEFIDQRRSALGLRRLLRQALNLAADIMPFERVWHPLEEDDLAMLGRSRLNPGMALGQRVCSVHHCFCIRLRLADFAAYQRCLPGALCFAEMVRLVRRYVGENMCWTLQLELPVSQRPRLRLGVDLPLGLATWLGNAGTGVPQGCSLSAVRFYL